MSSKSTRPRWRFLVELPGAYNPSTRPGGLAESMWGRSWTLEREDGRQAVVHVEASPEALAAYLKGTLPQTARHAIQTEGRSAVERHLAEKRLPELIHITGGGVRRPR